MDPGTISAHFRMELVFIGHFRWASGLSVINPDKGDRNYAHSIFSMKLLNGRIKKEVTEFVLQNCQSLV